MKPDVPHVKVEQLAIAVREIMLLKQQQSMTQAELIRWCVLALRKPKPHQFNFQQDHKAQAQWAQDRTLALVYLDWLATQLEDQSKPSGTLTLSTEGTDHVHGD